MIEWKGDGWYWRIEKEKECERGKILKKKRKWKKEEERSSREADEDKYIRNERQLQRLTVDGYLWKK
jgi:hypothetical protein